jgi:integrase
MARRRYQTGELFKRGKRNPVWTGRYREDVIQSDGQTRRIYRSVVLGPVSRLTEKQARRAFEPFLARVNSIDYQPERFAKIGEFSETWEREVLQHHKPSSIKAAQSHLRTYIRPWLGDVRLEDFTIRAQQSFVTRLSQVVSRKTATNVLSTLSSILRTAKSWGYSCHKLDMSELRLPASPVREDARHFTADQIKRILAVAPEPFRTMFAIAAMTGLRAGEILGLQRDDLDFERRLIRVRRSVWYGHVQSLKTKTSRAPVAMPQILAEMLRQYLATWKPGPEGFLFVNRKGHPCSGNKVVEFGLWPVLDVLGIPRAGMHAFRHGHASLLIDVGANPKVTQQQMRHSDSRTTMEVYAHVVGNAQHEAVDKVGELLRPDAKLCTQVHPN